MAVAIEKVGSRRGRVSFDNPEIELLYAVKGSEDEAEIRLKVEQTIPFLYNLVSNLGVQQLVFQEYSHDHRGGGLWDVAAKYGRKEQKKVGDSSFSFDTTGGTKHVTTSIKTVRSYPEPVPPLAPPPDFKGAIGVNNDTVQGVDVVSPAYAFSETHYLPNGFVTGAYKTKLHRMTGKVNNATFTRADGQVFAKGECQFLGASGSKRGTEDWEITFKFTGSPNAAGLVFGDIGGVVKEGFEYVWVRFKDAEDQGVLVKQPEYVYVEQVLEYGAFGDLGIGE